MVLTAAGTRRTPALVVPDEQTWTVLGLDPVERGLQPSFDPGTVRRVLARRGLPAQIAQALEEYCAGLGDDVHVEYVELPGEEHAGVDEGSAHVQGEHSHAEHDTDAHDRGEPGHGEHAHVADGHDAHPHGESHPAGHHGHGGHHDMMAIVGEPSADGLVMEPIRLSYGPIGTPLPGGLVVDVTLDGDVVAGCEVRPVVRHDHASRLPDLLSPVAWALAHDSGGSASSDPWLRIAAVEIERAVSHVAWLRSLGRLLDHEPLVARCSRALRALSVSRNVLPRRPITKAWLRAAVGDGDLDECRERLEDLVTWTQGSRSLRWRLSGRAVVTHVRAQELALRGPVARASAVEADARAADPVYAELGFAAVVNSRGDALARTCVRVEEALVAVRLAMDALALDYVGADAPSTEPGPPVAIEGPRGALTAAGGSAEPAARAMRRVAADSMIGSEWSAALVGLVSFDLSPWSDSS